MARWSWRAHTRRWPISGFDEEWKSKQRRVEESTGEKSIHGVHVTAGR